MRARILLVAGWLVAFTSFAQTKAAPVSTRAISLRECIELALRRNLDIQIQHLTADIARYDLGAAYGVYSPILTFSGRHRFVDFSSDYDPKKFNPYLPYQEDRNYAGPSLSGRFPFGFSYDFEAFAGEKNTLTDFRSNPEDAALFPPFGIRDTNNAFAAAGITMRQHLLRDFWIDHDWQKVLVRRRDLKISEQAFRFQVMRTVLAVQTGYFDLLMAREAIRVQEKALELKQQFLSETRRRVEVGDAPPLDAEQAETQLQNTITALNTARELFQVHQSALKDLLTDNFREWVGLELVPTEPLLAIPEAVNLAESFHSAVQNRPDLAEARLAVEKSSVLVRYHVNQLLPSLDLVGHFSGTGSQTNLSSALSDTFNFRYPQYFYGAVISFPLDNLGERNNYRASKAARNIAELELKKAEQKVLVEVEQWAERVRARFSRIDSTRKARTYAESALAAEEKKLQNGMSTSFVVLQLQEVLTSARMAEAQALAEYNIAVGQLAFADASILDRHHLSVEVK